MSDDTINRVSYPRDKEKPFLIKGSHISQQHALMCFLFMNLFLNLFFALFHSNSQNEAKHERRGGQSRRVNQILRNSPPSIPLSFKNTKSLKKQLQFRVSASRLLCYCASYNLINVVTRRVAYYKRRRSRRSKKTKKKQKRGGGTDIFWWWKNRVGKRWICRSVSLQICIFAKL